MYIITYNIRYTYYVRMYETELQIIEIIIKQKPDFNNNYIDK